MPSPTWTSPEVERLFTEQDTLFKVTRHHARTKPESIAFTFLVDGETEERNLTYAALDKQARAIAGYIQSVCKPGEHVLLLYGQSLDYIAAFAACQYAGVIPVPAYPPEPMRSNRTLPRLKAIVGDCGASLALGAAENVGWLVASQLGLRQTVSTDNWTEWSSLPWTEPDTRADQIAFLQYTSGSTGSPRGVMVTHRNLWAQFHTTQIGDSDKVIGLSWLPFYHDMGLIGGILTPLGFGRRSILMSPLAFVQHPLRWPLAMWRYRATITGAPNFAFDMCVSKFDPQEAAGLDLSSVQIILTGAEPVRSDSLDRFMDLFAPYGLRRDVWRPCYGMAETTLGATSIRYGSDYRRGNFSVAGLENNRAELVNDDKTPSRRLVGCGWALDGSEVIVVEPDKKIELGEGQVGEVWVRGPIVAEGYWNRPEENEATFHAYLANGGRGPFLRTGDLGFLHESQLYLTGRSKEVMVFWGRNVYPQDVEQTVWSAHASLKQNACAAFAVEEDDQEQLVVVQEINRPQKLDLDAMAQTIRAQVQAEFRVPFANLVFIKPGTLPKTSSGKTQRRATRELFLANQLEVVKQWRFVTALPKPSLAEGAERPLPSRAEIHDWLVARVAKQCGLDKTQIDAGEPLTRYVMDSVTAVAIAMDMQQWLGRAIAPTVVFDSPSVAMLAERLADPQSYTKETVPLPTAVDDLSAAELDKALAQLLGNAPSGGSPQAADMLGSPQKGPK